MKQSWDWFQARAHGTHAKAWLFIFSFSESSFFIVPPEVLLIPMLIADSKRWLWYGVYTSGASVLGAVFGYIIAFFFFDTFGQKIIEAYHLTEDFQHMGELFENNAFWVMFTAAFTPIPYKVAVLAGGFFQINFVTFLIASIIGRGLRYVLISYIVHKFGAKTTELVLRYSNWVTIAIAGVLGVAFVIWYLFFK